MTNLGTICSIHKWESEQNSPELPIWEQIVTFTDGSSEQNSYKLSIWEQIIQYSQMGVQDSPQFVPK